MNEMIESVPLIAFEAQAERFRRIICSLALGWSVSVIVLTLAIVGVLAA